MKYMNPFLLHLMENKVSRLKVLFQHKYYYVELMIFIEVPDVKVLIIDTLTSTQTNIVEEDGEIAQENYSTSAMLQDLKSQRTIFEPDALHSRKRSKVNQPKNFLYSKKKSEKRKKFI